MPTENKLAAPEFDLNDADGGRGYIAHLFKTVLRRHDYRQYITERLAGDFACTLAQHFEDIKARETALQQRLTAADQLVADQGVALKRIHDRADAFAEDECSMRVASVEVIRDIAARVLSMVSKPPAYKPGLYAVRHIDNWDGERDVVLTFAILDADGKWTDKETGDALLTYRGDKVLRAWPLDCSDAPDTQIIGVPRNWLEDWALELVEAAQDGGQMSNQVEHLLELHAKP